MAFKSKSFKAHQQGHRFRHRDTSFFALQDLHTDLRTIAMKLVIFNKYDISHETYYGTLMNSFSTIIDYVL